MDGDLYPDAIITLQVTDVHNKKCSQMSNFTSYVLKTAVLSIKDINVRIYMIDTYNMLMDLPWVWVYFIIY